MLPSLELPNICILVSHTNGRSIINGVAMNRLVGMEFKMSLTELPIVVNFSSKLVTASKEWNFEVSP